MHKAKAVSVIEYSLLVAVTALVMVNMSTYIKRGAQGRLKEMSDYFIGRGQSEDASTGEVSSEQKAELRRSERLGMDKGGKSSLSLAEFRNATFTSIARDKNAPFLADFVNEEAGRTLPPEYVPGKQMESDTRLSSLSVDEPDGLKDLVENMTAVKNDAKDPSQPGYWEGKVGFEKIVKLAEKRQEREAVQAEIKERTEMVNNMRSEAAQLKTKIDSIRCPRRRRWLCQQMILEARAKIDQMRKDAAAQESEINTKLIPKRDKLNRLIADMESGLSAEDKAYLKGYEDELNVGKPREAEE